MKRPLLNHDLKALALCYVGMAPLTILISAGISSGIISVAVGGLTGTLYALLVVLTFEKRGEE